jgi:hypothetical protein
MSPRRDEFGFGKTTENGKWLDTVFNTAVATYFSAFDEWENPTLRASIHVFAINDAREKLEPLYRQLARMLKENLLVSSLDLDAMGLPARPRNKKSRTPVATLAPSINAILVRINTVTIRFRRSDSKKIGRPAGQHGVEVCFVISDAPVIDHDQLVSSRFSTRSPVEIEFHGRDRGKIVYFAARWINNVGQAGPFSRVQSSLIP